MPVANCFTVQVSDTTMLRMLTKVGNIKNPAKISRTFKKILRYKTKILF